MATEEKVWHQRFINYMIKIINDPAYEGLPITKKDDGSYSWIATAKSKTGIGRIDWCITKAEKLGLITEHKSYPGMYADVMLEIHPTKWKICQICGKEMSLYYHYPNANLIKAITKKFGIEFTDCDHIEDIWEELDNQGFSYSDIANFFIEKDKQVYVNPYQEDIL